jgi:hypothetical protein
LKVKVNEVMSVSEMRHELIATSGISPGMSGDLRES